MMKQLHHPDFSLWQSAIDQTIARQSSPGLPIQRPGVVHDMVSAATQVASLLEKKLPLPVQQKAPSAALPGGAVAAAAEYCASIWWEIAKAQVAGDTKAEADWRAKLGPFSSCDPRYAEAAAQYVDFKAMQGKIPYKVWKNLNDFIIDWKIPPQARIAILGDWGTGQADAQALLGAIARKKPDVVIHLGDIYYSGTEFEMENYFLNIWSRILDLTRVHTFTLAGNHDMYSGGAPYYQLIQKLGQPASYFCLRNDDWQFIALDTGLHDDDALDAQPTYLEDTEVQWLKDKVATAAGRHTVLLSHHQLFTAFESIGGQSVNTRLLGQVGSVLPQVTVWFWGHEHNQVIYGQNQGVLGRCIGHAAYPVGTTEIADNPKFPSVPVVK